jgi:hypothetical protein
MRRLKESPMNDVKTVPAKRSVPLLLIGAWLIVTIPAGWGVTQTVRRSLALFHSAQPPAAATAADAVAPDRGGH